MKRLFVLLAALAITLPALAITESQEVLQAELKYQQKLNKIKQKQELKCIKHPEACISSPMKETTLTLGTAQKSINIGTSQDEVALTLGAPNIVTTDSNGKETWIYDKISSVSSYNNNGFNIGMNLLGGGGGVGNSGLGGGGGIFGVNRSTSGGNYQSSQKTLTIVIKFNRQKVDSFQYHMSNF